MQMSSMQATKPLPETLNLKNLLTKFATEKGARKFLESWLWPDGPICPRCKTNDQSRIAKDKGKTAARGYTAATTAAAPSP